MQGHRGQALRYDHASRREQGVVGLDGTRSRRRAEQYHLGVCAYQYCYQYEACKTVPPLRSSDASRPSRLAAAVVERKHSPSDRSSSSPYLIAKQSPGFCHPWPVSPDGNPVCRRSRLAISFSARSLGSGLFHHDPSGETEVEVETPVRGVLHAAHGKTAHGSFLIVNGNLCGEGRATVWARGGTSRVPRVEDGDSIEQAACGQRQDKMRYSVLLSGIIISRGI